MTEQTIGTVNVSGGSASIQLDTTDLTSGSYTIRAVYNENNHYREVTDTGTLTVQSQTLVNPWSGLLDISNWKAYTASNIKTGTTSTLSSSMYTIDTVNAVLQFKSTRYFVYNCSLQDFLDYYNNEFDIIFNPGNQNWRVGFIKITSNGCYTLGVTRATPNNSNTTRKLYNEEANVTPINANQVTTGEYNVMTYNVSQGSLTVYYMDVDGSYVSYTISMGSIDPSEYYLYCYYSSSGGNIHWTANTSLIQNPSRPP